MPDLDHPSRESLPATGPAWAARLAILVVLGVGIALASNRAHCRAVSENRAAEAAEAAVEGAVEVQ